MDIMRRMAMENLYRNMPREYAPEEIPAEAPAAVPVEAPIETPYTQIDPRVVQQRPLLDKQRLADDAKKGFIQSLIMPILGPRYKETQSK